MHLAESFLVLLQRFGNQVVDVTPVAELSDALEKLKSDRDVQLQIDTEMLEQKVNQVKELRDEIIRRKIESLRKKENESELEPPQNFREISVIPQAADLNLHNKPFLRANVVGGSYKDLEHYLDVQFRLLREDFILPLRRGIEQLRKDNSSLGTSSVSDSKHANNMSIYRHVTVLYPVCNGKGMVYKIRFDNSYRSLRRVKWEKSKRLKFGSLLCLSADDFYNLLFATVENRDTNDLYCGELEVRFEGVQLERLSQSIEQKEEFDMVESPAFFEAYRHVLEGLQKIQPDELPFQEHIIKCNQNVGPPEYETKTKGFFDMSDVMNKATEIGVNDIGLDKTMEEEIPDRMSTFTDDISSDDNSEESSDSDSDHRRLRSRAITSKYGPKDVNIYDLQLDQVSSSFNESQTRAFKMALTKKIAVIQGPPGTGKTYVGQKIARVLLRSASLWQEDGNLSPILMVSYTNHALDEFLGGLPKEGIVRVGGRCSEEMKRFSLKCRRDEARMRRKVPKQIMLARIRVRDDLRQLQEGEACQRSSAVLECSRRGILSFQVLNHFMEGFHVTWFKDKATEGTKALFLDWLAIELVAGKESEQKVDYDVASSEDFQMQVSLREFANDEDFEDKNGLKVLQPSEVVICRAEETVWPDKFCKDLESNEIMTENEEKHTRDLWKMSPNRRWKLYRLWLQRAEKHYLKTLQNIQLDYERILARQREVMQEEDLHVLQDARVIGMTTTCAARYRQILQRISPKIVLVEEAAEVLEAHIITSLTKGCQHLILIGDHQQLRPSNAVFELAKKYKLDVSLFERMITVGIPCERLSVQHRMRPEIAALMKHIYTDLENHESVEKYEDIKGIKKNMFFVNHSHLENHNDESHSHTNEHEATFVVALCRYLLQQGYIAEQITLLTTYTGQMFAIRDCLKQKNDEELKSVRLTTVDNFQGEENDIILLSLVRSNKDEKIGFIKMVNRACVALSRAKKGFYCIGNFDLLSKHSEIWSKIVNDLKASESIGDALPLVCQNHHTEEKVETADDFREKVPSGGCSRPCQVRLSCGHAYRLTCHPNDPEHKDYLCTAECPKTIDGCSHPCRRLCWQECETVCRMTVDKTLPSCGHRKRVPCVLDVSRVKCELQCEKFLPKCGHRCQASCGEPCTTKCKERVKKSDWPCGHDVTTTCSAIPGDCPFPCEVKLECGHKCKVTHPITDTFLGGEDKEDALFIQLPDCKHIFAVSDLDSYMDMPLDNSIKLKSCPRCKAAIRRSLRYGNVIKQQLQNIEEVKKKVIGHSSELEEAKERLNRRLIDLTKQFDQEIKMEEWKRFERRVERMSRGIMAAVTENQVTLMERYCRMSDKLKQSLLNDVARREASSESRLEGCLLQEEFDHFKKRFMSELATEKELRDINLEFTRLNLQLELCLLKHDVMRLKLTLDETSSHVMQEIRDDLSSGKLIEAEKLDKHLEKLVEIRNAYPALGPLTPEERKQIVSAVGLKQGHWFKCPKGHVYVIGECGGAMERGTCPDCGAVIGGANHALEEGNELAPEMDGARHAAWSEQANLEN
ncbi:NFX1-type zinc finger-containing protein 1 [Porites harrisoni]